MPATAPEMEVGIREGCEQEFVVGINLVRRRRLPKALLRASVRIQPSISFASPTSKTTSRAEKLRRDVSTAGEHDFEMVVVDTLIVHVLWTPSSYVCSPTTRSLGTLRKLSLPNGDDGANSSGVDDSRLLDGTYGERESRGVGLRKKRGM
ncbi:hypothetical protein SCHPADRAFT_911447 [Schizopora paradoxa]|uniref:Uncharacterized protein n=1 Tax=Schizopora paradoxa TaxID=27342 RepID=A0A0H2RIV7_9AGAM|nr:hypothetical protein SCHPADRAFT_911447 [Schizopora paradoxa]